jgi:hypothetical protein
MPAPIPCGRFLVLGVSLALVQGCVTALASRSTDVTTVAPPSRAEAGPNSAIGSERSGFRFSLGLGLGKADLTCDGCVFDSRTGYTGFLSAAHAVAPKTLLGVEATGWSKEISGATVRIWGIMAQLTQYLSSRNGPFLSAGLGFTGFHAHDNTGAVDPADEEVSGNGLGFSGRFGYEIGLGGMAIVPYVAYLRGLGGGGVSQGDTHMSTHVNIHNVQFGVAIAGP